MNYITKKQIMNGYFLNIGLKIGVDNLTKKVGDNLPHKTVFSQLSDIAKKIVIITDRSLVEEDTMVVELIRPIDDFSINYMLKVFGQKSIPYLSKGYGRMYVSKECGDFNPYYFIMTDGTRLSEQKVN